MVKPGRKFLIKALMMTLGKDIMNLKHLIIPVGGGEGGLTYERGRDARRKF